MAPNGDKIDLDIPLIVDLDGTLLKTDILLESFFSLLLVHPLYLFLIPVWLVKGKAYLKQQIANRVELDVAMLPINQEFLEYLRAQHDTGRRLVLATASNAKFARGIADHLGLFDEVLASHEKVNLAGQHKLESLQEAFGDKRFDYAGNSRVDLKIWPHAHRAILVNPSPGVKAAAERLACVEGVFDEEGGRLKEHVRALRPHQWLKNLLVFVPLLTAHQVQNLPLVLQSLLSFFAFCLCASSVYLLNDLLDLNADRHHPRKRFRPLAAGTVSIVGAGFLIPILLIAAFGVTLLLPAKFLIALATYYTITLAYSLRLKRVLMLDTLTLAGLYTLRIIAGAAAISVPLSFWLLAFSIFLFFSLAIAKRHSELLVAQGSNQKIVKSRGYRVTDMEVLKSLGPPSGLLAVLVLALYINSDDVSQLYTHPKLIWLLCPLMLYWITRVWLITHRGRMDDDPVIFAIRDPVSRWVVMAGTIILLLAV
jgi:4-hydroxybenzoate polyprenyltransferase